MIITVEISYYPFAEEYATPISAFIERLTAAGLTVETGIMSSVITGEYKHVMQGISSSMKDLMEQYPSVFTIKISNSCPV